MGHQNTSDKPYKDEEKSKSTVPSKQSNRTDSSGMSSQHRISRETESSHSESQAIANRDHSENGVPMPSASATVTRRHERVLSQLQPTPPTASMTLAVILQRQSSDDTDLDDDQMEIELIDGYECTQEQEYSEDSDDSMQSDASSIYSMQNVVFVSGSSEDLEQQQDESILITSTTETYFQEASPTDQRQDGCASTEDTMDGVSAVITRNTTATTNGNHLEITCTTTRTTATSPISQANRAQHWSPAMAFLSMFGAEYPGIRRVSHPPAATSLSTCNDASSSSRACNGYSSPIRGVSINDGTSSPLSKESTSSTTSSPATKADNSSMDSTASNDQTSKDSNDLSIATEECMDNDSIDGIDILGNLEQWLSYSNYYRDIYQQAEESVLDFTVLANEEQNPKSTESKGSEEKASSTESMTTESIPLASSIPLAVPERIHPNCILRDYLFVRKISSGTFSECWRVKSLRKESLIPLSQQADIEGNPMETTATKATNEISNNNDSLNTQANTGIMDSLNTRDSLHPKAMVTPNIQGDFAAKVLLHGKDWQQELSIWKSLEHPNILPLIDHFTLGSLRIAISPLASHGSLLQVTSASDGPWSSTTNTGSSYASSSAASSSDSSNHHKNGHGIDGKTSISGHVANAGHSKHSQSTSQLTAISASNHHHSTQNRSSHTMKHDVSKQVNNDSHSDAHHNGTGMQSKDIRSKESSRPCKRPILSSIDSDPSLHHSHHHGHPSNNHHHNGNHSHGNSHNSVYHLHAEMTKSIFVQLVKAINHMHNQGIAHRDIKLENILIHGIPQVPEHHDSETPEHQDRTPDGRTTDMHHGRTVHASKEASLDGAPSEKAGKTRRWKLTPHVYVCDFGFSQRFNKPNRINTDESEQTVISHSMDNPLSPPSSPVHAATQSPMTGQGNTDKDIRLLEDDCLGSLHYCAPELLCSEFFKQTNRPDGNMQESRDSLKTNSQCMSGNAKSSYESTTSTHGISGADLVHDSKTKRHDIDCHPLNDGLPGIPGMLPSLRFPDLSEMPASERLIKKDCWALGVVLYCLCTGRFPFAEDYLPRLKLSIAKGQYEPVGDACVDDLLARLLEVNPYWRYDTNQTLNHPFCTQSK